MTVQGGGGGRKIPPGTSAPTSTRAEKPASTPPTATTAKTPSTPPTTARAKDAFENADPRHASDRAALPLHEQTTATGGTSGVDSMISVLEQSRDQILDEHRAVREKLRRVVGELARAGFERGVLEDRRAEIVALRTRLGALRRRLQHIQRRLKAALGKTRLGDADVTKALASQLERLARLEPGVERAFVALSAFEQAAGVDPGAGSVLKHNQLGLDGDDVDAEAVGAGLARAVPGAAIAMGIAHLLGAPPMASMEGAAVTPAMELPTLPTRSKRSTAIDADDAVANLQGLADLLLVSLR